MIAVGFLLLALGLIFAFVHTELGNQRNAAIALLVAFAGSVLLVIGVAVWLWQVAP